MSRRAALGVGLGVVTVAGLSHLVGVDDDALRALGVAPHPEPDPGDASILRRAIRDQRELVVLLDVALQQEPDVATAAPTVRAAARAQLAQLGGKPPTGDVGARPTTVVEVARRFATVGRRREADALRASDHDLVRVLASLSAGQAQVARTLGRAS